MPYCVNCGAKIELTWEKCSNCGASLAKIATSGVIKEENNYKKEIPAASPSKRICSGLIDCIIAISLTLFIWVLIAKKVPISGTRIRWMIIGLILPFLPALYFVLKDSLGGKSFGKMIVGLTTISLDKLKPINLPESLLRNAIFALIAIPIIGWFAFLVFAIFVGVQIVIGRPQRLGDAFARTMVIDDRNIELLEKSYK